MRMTNLGVSTALATVLLLASACGGGSESATEGVASLDVAAGSGEETAAAGDETTTDLEPEEAALAFSACMRDEGLDFPDIAVDAEGRIDLRSGFDDLDPRSEEFQAAMQNCQSFIESAGFGEGGRAGIGENVEIQDALVEFSACVRDEGYDVGDIELGGPGQAGGAAPNTDDAGDGTTDGTDGEATGEGRGQGQRQGGFGDRSTQFATQLGLDYDDPEVATVIDGCMPIIDEAFAGAGLGQG